MMNNCKNRKHLVNRKPEEIMQVLSRTKEKALVGKYASEHGVSNAVRHFKEKVLKEITIRDWKREYECNL